ncbi:MAG TPA: DUF2125 domain-containing protein [Devosia sp.]|nr:DUF2125 domain-containing protein [Devosia sp.]
MNRFKVLAIIVVIILAGWTGAWMFASTKIRQMAQAQFAALKDQPQNLDCENLDISGFPFRFDVTCTYLAIHDLDRTITIPRVKLTVLVYRPTHALLFARGPATIQDSFSGARKELRWSSLQASLRTNGWALARFSLQVRDLIFLDTLVGDTTIAGADLFEAHLLEEESAYDPQNRRTTIAALARLDGLSVPDAAISGASATMQAKLRQMPDDLRLWRPATIAANWNETGTGLEAVELKGADATSSFSLVGRLTTTPQHMLSGNFDFFSSNVSDRLEGIVSPAIRQIAFGSKSEDGQNYQSYSLVHGVVLAGNIPITSLPPLR